MSNEQRYFDALKRIARFQTVERIRKHSRHDLGLGSEEALEYAYENAIQAAKDATRGRRRPKE